MLGSESSGLVLFSFGSKRQSTTMSTPYLKSHASGHILTSRRIALERSGRCDAFVIEAFGDMVRNVQKFSILVYLAGGEDMVVLRHENIVSGIVQERESRLDELGGIADHAV